MRYEINSRKIEAVFFLGILRKGPVLFSRLFWNCNILVNIGKCLRRIKLGNNYVCYEKVAFSNSNFMDQNLEK